MKKQRKWKPYSGRILSSLLALCLLDRYAAHGCTGGGG